LPVTLDLGKFLADLLHAGELRRRGFAFLAGPTNAHQEKEFLRFSGSKSNPGLQRAAGVVADSQRVCALSLLDNRGIMITSITSDEGGAVCVVANYLGATNA